MKTHFPHYYIDTEKLWAESLFVFDTSSLLSFYNYSESTRNDLFGVLKTLSEKQRLWLPHQVALEFHRGRQAAIAKHRPIYNETVNLITRIRIDWDQNKGKILKKAEMDPLAEAFTLLDIAFEEVLKRIDDASNRVPSLSTNDSILEELTDLFDGRVGNPYGNIEEIEKEAELRFEKRIPPGWKDAASDADDLEQLDGQANEPKGKQQKRGKVGGKQYGDYILWMEILHKAKGDKKPIILVVDDLKEDWWKKIEKLVVGPRYELREEMYKESGCQFEMYRTSDFLNKAKDYLKASVKDETIQETKERQSAKHAEAYVRQLTSDIQNLDVSMMDLERHIQIAETKKVKLIHRSNVGPVSKKIQSDIAKTEERIRSLYRICTF